MKISSYNINQKAVNTFHREEKTTFTSELLMVKELDYSKVKTIETPDEEVIHEQSKYELIDSLMAYLDRRKFDSTEIPVHDVSQAKCDDTFSIVQKSLMTEANGITNLHQITESRQVYESESLTFISSGEITTEDGKSFGYSYDIKFKRKFYEANSMIIQKGFIDPLVLNLDNRGVSFNNKKIQLDLDLDGKLDTFQMLNHGNGFLVLDKNNNGKVDDGSELFGPSTNDGFSELMAYDMDNNHWIDENDLIYHDLKVWMLDEDGKETLVDIKDTNIGAIFLGSVEGKFDYKNGDQTIARITDSSIVLKEDGSSSAIHEIRV